jgi:hypothetical protein
MSCSDKKFKKQEVSKIKNINGEWKYLLVNLEIVFQTISGGISNYSISMSIIVAHSRMTIKRNFTSLDSKVKEICTVVATHIVTVIVVMKMWIIWLLHDDVVMITMVSGVGSSYSTL